MNLTRKQKKYIKKHLKKERVVEIASDLKLPVKEIEEYLKKRWGEKKSKKFLTKTEHLQSVEVPPLSGQRHLGAEWLKENWKTLAFLAFLVFAVYFSSLNNEFVSDDIPGIVNDKNLGSLHYALSNRFNFIRPLFYFITYKIFGLKPLFYRIINILFHLGTVLSFYALLSLITSPPLPVFAAAIFAVHPILTESVTWISGGGYSQYSFFLLISFIAYIAYLSRKNKKILIASLITFVIALNSSEKAIILPLLFLLFTFSLNKLSKHWKSILPFFIICSYLVFKYLGGKAVSERTALLQTQFYQTPQKTNPLLQIPIAITSYLKLIFWPKNLTLYHSEMSFGQGEYFLRLGVFVLFLIIIAYFFKKDRRIFFWLSFFIISLLPTLTPLGISWIVAERYVYLGSIGIFVVVALIIQKIGQVFKNQKISYVILAVIVFFLGMRTIVRNADWKNQDALWLATAKTSPSSPQNHNNLGDYYGRQGNFEKAVEEFKKAIELNPNYGDAFHNLANTYQQMERVDEAIENYQKAASINPNLWQSYQNLAAIYFDQGKFDLAKQELEKAIKANPQDSNLYTNLGIIYLKLNDNEKAKQAFQQAIQIDPQNQKAKQFLLTTP